jgi:hypothetical protein
MNDDEINKALESLEAWKEEIEKTMDDALKALRSDSITPPNDAIDNALDALKAEIDKLKARCIVSDDDLKHIRAISDVAYSLWSGTTSDAYWKLGENLRSHIRVLLDKFKF